MDRRTFLGAASAAFLVDALAPAAGFAAPPAALKPMDVGLLIVPHDAPEATFKRVHDMGFDNCFLSLDGYINGFTKQVADQFGDLMSKYSLVATTVEVVGPAPLVWDFLQGPIDHRPRSTQVPRRAHRRTAPGFRLCQDARHSAGTNPLRLHS